MIEAAAGLARNSLGEPPGGLMHQGSNVQFERALGEFAKWRAIPEQARSPAPAWWWGTAIELRDVTRPMPRQWCEGLQLAEGATYADGARFLLHLFADQRSLPSADGFPGHSSQPDCR
jgi:hypothetical protein